MYPYVVLVAVALYALARELGAPGPAAVLLALMVTAVPVVVQPGLTRGLLDPVMYSMLATGVVFLIRHDRSGARADLILAGLALGICFGTKFYGYTVVAAVVAIWAVARIARGLGAGRVLRELTGLGALILAGGGIWMLRNWVETGNPLLPLTVDPLGITLFEAPADPQRPLFGFTIADYLGDPGVWTDTLAHQFRIAAGAPLVVLAADHRRSRRRARATARRDRPRRDRRSAGGRDPLRDHSVHRGRGGGRPERCRGQRPLRGARR